MEADNFHIIMSRFFVKQFYIDIWEKVSNDEGNISSNYFTSMIKYKQMFDPKKDSTNYNKIIGLWHKYHRELTYSSGYISYSEFVVLAVKKICVGFPENLTADECSTILKYVVNDIIIDFCEEIKIKSNIVIGKRSHQGYEIMKKNFVEIIVDHLNRYKNAAISVSGGYDPHKDSQRKVIKTLQSKNKELYKICKKRTEEKRVLGKFATWVKIKYPKTFSEYSSKRDEHDFTLTDTIDKKSESEDQHSSSDMSIEEYKQQINPIENENDPIGNDETLLGMFKTIS